VRQDQRARWWWARCGSCMYWSGCCEVMEVAHQKLICWPPSVAIRDVCCGNEDKRATVALSEHNAVL
jgi:hypothetical protein